MNKNTKKILKITLLIFALGSIAYALQDEIRKPAPTVEAHLVSQPQEASAAQKKESEKPNRLVAYYFFGGARCQSCILIERYSYAAILKEFAEDLKTGKIQWQTIDVMQPQNRHYIEGYQLHTKSIVISLIKDGKESKWKNLEEIWEHVQEENRFSAYIVSEFAAYLAEIPQ